MTTTKMTATIRGTRALLVGVVNGRRTDGQSTGHAADRLARGVYPAAIIMENVDSGRVLPRALRVTMDRTMAHAAPLHAGEARTAATTTNHAKSRPTLAAPAGMTNHAIFRRSVGDATAIAPLTTAWR